MTNKVSEEFKTGYVYDLGGCKAIKIKGMFLVFENNGKYRCWCSQGDRKVKDFTLLGKIDRDYILDWCKFKLIKLKD